jgi:hypothetical protein
MGQKGQNRAAVAWFRAAAGLHEVEGGAVGLQSPSRAELEKGDGE